MPFKLLPKRIVSILSTPKNCRYDPESPPKFTIWLNFLFSAALFTVANLYYNQPVLNKIAEDFNVDFETASTVATLMQSGYAGGLFFLCPLGDWLRPRPLILILWIGLCVTNSFPVFQALSMICGFTTVTPQLALPIIGGQVPPNRRASAVQIGVSGILLGSLLGRLCSGIASNYATWRLIYWVALGLQYLLFLLLFAYMPDYPSRAPESKTYFHMLWSTVYMTFTEPLLLQVCIQSFCVSAVFSAFWTTLTFQLASPPYEYSSLEIGLFGLIGVIAIVLGPFYGRVFMDHFVPWFSAFVGETFALVGVIISTFTGDMTVAGPIIEAITLDMGTQTSQTANRVAAFSIDATAMNRVNSAFVVCGFLGQFSGAAFGNKLYADGGWIRVGGATVGLMGLALVVLCMRGPGEKGWVGWSGGWNMRMPMEAEEDAEAPAEVPAVPSASVGSGEYKGGDAGEGGKI
ncbi:membrane protein [Immersiella caudata]|uniref:Membrane protein n=1 Tax=Immersiella caudata TaxID=314043 RepID=A0AA40BU24_9PEZI|nr:membrane protein [Immersiella caudata]